MVLCDTNIFIHAFNGNLLVINQLNKIGHDKIVLSAITIMELYQGMGNKHELASMRKKIKYYDIAHINQAISEKAIDLIHQFKLSHGLQIPDAIIGATALVNDIPLYTFNVKDFQFIPYLKLYEI